MDLSPEARQRVHELNGGLKNTLIVTFYMDAVRSERRSDGYTETRYDAVTGEEKRFRVHGEGREVFEDIPFVEIRAPGDVLNVMRKPARDVHKDRWPEEWAAFQSSQIDGKERLVGTPLDRLPFISKAQMMEFASRGIRTAEALANTADVDGQKFPAFSQTRQRARDFLQAAAGNAPIEAMRAELESRDAEMAALKEQMRAMQEALSKKK